MKELRNERMNSSVLQGGESNEPIFSFVSLRNSGFVTHRFKNLFQLYSQAGVWEREVLHDNNLTH
ncbi:MAG: hypothetical protein H8E57_03550 [Candidatus Cloacimonetes bacterium]|nr:hypothetical protein [Candidatus Cloacimonadota bacterium]